ncbi:MAG: divergent polysaccharide deacetylase family protein [Alphaproteobacteria bacterium]|nr:divergent polysaccharide deacetylase family protein [Alphaproteobacteria bacterium]
MAGDTKKSGQHRRADTSLVRRPPNPARWPQRLILINLLLWAGAAFWIQMGKDATLARRQLAIPMALVEVPPELIQQGVQEINRTREEVAKINSTAERDLPWHKYAAPFDVKDTRPKIAVLVNGLGLQHEMTQQMLQSLPAGVTLGFSSYGRQLKEWLGFTRGQRREVVLSLPLQSSAQANPRESKRSEDAGPFALGADLTPMQNIGRLDWLLERGEGAVGLMPNANEAFWQDSEAADTLLSSLRERGYLLATPTATVVQSSLAAGVPTASLTVALDQPVDEATLNSQLQRVESTAKAEGAAAISLPAYPALLAPLNAWIAKLADRGFALVPLSAVTEQRTAINPPAAAPAPSPAATTAAEKQAAPAKTNTAKPAPASDKSKH